MSDISSVDTDKSLSDNTNSTVNDDSTIEKNFVPEIFFANNQRQFRYYKMIDKYFKKCDQNLIDKMVRIINKDNEEGDCISLRVLEWVVTKCSKKNVDIKIEDKEYFSINIMYKAQLKSYKKKNFDPFRRDRKFLYNYDKKDNTKQVITTLGQLNFFKWAISNKIIDCVEKHYQTIIEAMNRSNKIEKIKKKNKLIAKTSKSIKSTKTSKSTKSFESYKSSKIDKINNDMYTMISDNSINKSKDKNKDTKIKTETSKISIKNIKKEEAYNFIVEFD